MKKITFGAIYLALAGTLTLLNSCQDDPVTPNNPADPNGTDTTWVNDTTNNGGNGTPEDSTDWNNGGGDPIDSTFNGGGDPVDSTFNGGGNGTDSTWIDSLGG